MDLLQFSPALQTFYTIVRNSDDVANVKILIQAHPGILEESRSKLRSVLHSAAVYGRLEIIRYLLPLASDELLMEKSKEPCDTRGATCLRWAAYWDNHEIVRLILTTLIARGLEVDTWDGDQRGLLSESPSMEMLQLFQELHPTSLTFPDFDGAMAIHHVLESDSNVDSVAYLISLNPSLLDVITVNGWTLLHYAAFYSSESDNPYELCRLLLQTGRLNVDAVTSDQRTPFQLARHGQSPSTVAKLLAACSSSVADKVEMGLSEDEIGVIRHEVYFNSTLADGLSAIVN